MTRPADPPVRISRWDGGWSEADDRVAAEEPLQLLLDGEPLSIVMRTPGADVELALGLLFAERVIDSLDDVVDVAISAEAEEAPPGVAVLRDRLESNEVDVRLRQARKRPQRSFLASSSCGVCGATTVESLELDHSPVPPGPALAPEWLQGLAEALRAGQPVFALTGGLHAAGVFEAGGGLLFGREDVGRHNAVDKVTGRLLLEGRLPAHGLVLAVSGRAGYEVAQKAVRAGFAALVAVGAPSSLAVAVARRFDLTLLGFLRGGRFNVYSGVERLRDAPDQIGDKRAERPGRRGQRAQLRARP